MPVKYHPRIARLLIFVICGSGGVAATADDTAHPRLLIRAADLPRLRHACGLGQPGAATTGWGRFGRDAGHFQSLRTHFANAVRGDPLPGELAAAAFLHLVDPAGASDADLLEGVRTALEKPNWITTDPLELVLALDWCWGELPAGVRRDFILALRRQAEPLTPADSPLDPRRFRRKLVALALALAVDETDVPNPSWLALRSRLLSAAETYFKTTFPTFVHWRGLSPTSSAAAAVEESLTALAIELTGAVTRRDVWPEYRATAGRWLEHYVLAQHDHPALQHNFIYSDGTEAPLTPAPAWNELLPITAHLIAVRTRDPAAAWLAQRVEERMCDASDSLAPVWRWVPIVYGAAPIPCCDPTNLPAARNLGGAVIFRGGAGPEMTTVWIDAGPPFLRRREHFDAGHFLVQRGGHLVVDAADDVSLEAVPSKRGMQRLGGAREPFDYEQFLTATIAHNCVICWDAARVVRWYGTPYLPSGGQRCIEGTCGDFVTQLALQGRVTGRQRAYGQHAGAAYLALDLTPAYDRRTLNRLTREFVFFCGRALVVVDRVHLAYTRSPPNWILNLPARPQVDGQGLQREARVAGATNDAGVWRYDDATWLRWTDRDGSLWLTAPLPSSRRVRIVGGPAEDRLIPEGPHAGRVYVGGDKDGFERLIVPAERHAAQNAWYRLGKPTLLGKAFGKTPHWGRVEIEPVRREAAMTFVTLLVTSRADEKDPPAASLEERDDALILRVRIGDDDSTLTLPRERSGGGRLEAHGQRGFEWALPTDVQPDEPLRLQDTPTTQPTY